MASAATKRRSSGAFETIKTVVYAVLIAVLIRTVAFEPFSIPSESMLPTLLVGDYVFVSKFSYGYSRFSMPFSPDLFSGRILGRPPRRGDVAVFRLPKDTSIDYIKRIIGLPGDRIAVHAGQLFINGTQVARVPDGTFLAEGEGPPTMLRRYQETLPNGVRHPILKADDQQFAGQYFDPNNTQDYVVPEGFVFAMGDNRDNSQDSRFLDAVGFVPMENLIGRAEVIFFSIDGSHPWWQFWWWPLEIRYGRLLSGVS